MRRQSWIVLGIATFLGLIAVYLVNVYLSGAEQQRTQAVQTTRIAVARTALPFGARLSEANVQFVEWPVGSVPEGSFRAMAELAPMGRSPVVIQQIVAGEPILRAKLSGEGGRASLSALLAPDMRAAAIRITDVAGVAGFALPGDRVDVLMSRDMGSGGREQLTDILLQNVRIIAIDQETSTSTERPSLGHTATLEVNQEDAQKLVLGASVGTLSLILRSVRAPQEFIQYRSAIRSTELTDGLNLQPQAVAFAAGPAPPPAPAPGPSARAPAGPAPIVGPQVEVFRGTVARAYGVRPYVGR